MIVEEVRDRVRGVILGMAAGDRIGGPIRMAVKLSESLIIQNRFDVEHVTDTYFKWCTKDGFDTGPVTKRVFELTELGMSIKESVNQVDKELRGHTAGCNPVHRSPPIAMAKFIDDKELFSAAIQEASITHKHIFAGEVSAATLELCRNLILGIEWATALKNAAKGKTFKIRQALRINSTAPLKNCGFAPEVLTAAVFFVNKYRNFFEALNEAIKFAGSANYCPVVVGAIGGARWGAASIPKSALSHCEIILRVQNVADLLSDKWQ